MWTVTQLSTTVQTLLTTTADELARETGLVRRSSTLTGAHVVQALVLGWLNAPHARVQQLAQMAGTLGVPISPQGLDQRFRAAAAPVLRRVLEVAVGHLVTAAAVAIPLLQRLHGVYLLDRSTRVLPNELAALWRGCGGWRAVASSASSASSAPSASSASSAPSASSALPSHLPAQTEAAVQLQVQFDLQDQHPAWAGPARWAHAWPAGATADSGSCWCAAARRSGGLQHAGLGSPAAPGRVLARASAPPCAALRRPRAARGPARLAARARVQSHGACGPDSARRRATPAGAAGAPARAVRAVRAARTSARTRGAQGKR
jgi:hypothetical protein